MNLTSQHDKYNLNRIIVKPLYFGLTANILIPMALLLVCYYLENNRSWHNSIGDFANILFYLFGVLSIAQAGLALWWKENFLKTAMIIRKETFEQDFINALMERLKKIFIIVASISLYGYIYYFLAGRFKETVFFVLFSFIVFQVVRPRVGFIRKLINRQEKMIEQGIFRQE